MSVAFSWRGREDGWAPEIHPGRSPLMARTTRPVPLTPEQQAEAERIHAALVAASADDLQELAETLARTTDATIFGATQFAVRDIALRVGAMAIEAALQQQQKGGTSGRAGPATAAWSRPGSSGGGASGS